MYRRIIVLRFIDFGLKTKEQRDEIKVNLAHKLEVELNVEMVDERGNITGELENKSNYSSFKLIKKIEKGDVIGEVEIRYIEDDSLVNRNECVLKINVDGLNTNKFIFNKINSVFLGIIEILNPRYAFVDEKKHYSVFYKKNFIINENTIQNAIGRINYFRNDIVGQLKLIKVINRDDGIIGRSSSGLTLIIGISFEEKSNKKILRKIKEVEEKIRSYWAIKKYKVLKKENRDNDIVYVLWDGLEDKLINVVSPKKELELAEFYNLSLNEIDNKLIVVE